jgi:hypothetical protein
MTEIDQLTNPEWRELETTHFLKEDLLFMKIILPIFLNPIYKYCDHNYCKQFPYEINKLF